MRPISLSILLLMMMKPLLAGGHEHEPDCMQSNLEVETTRGNGDVFIEMFFRDAANVQSLLVEQKQDSMVPYHTIKKVCGVDIVHAETNRFVVLDTGLIYPLRDTYYRITLSYLDGHKEQFYGFLAGLGF